MIMEWEGNVNNVGCRGGCRRHEHDQGHDDDDDDDDK